MKLLTFAGILVAFVLFLLLFQHKMIYFPRVYGTEPASLLRVREIVYEISAGRQTAFFVPPEQKEPAGLERLWVVFGGNASLALDWHDFVMRYPDKNAGFLLIDYPGYGKCAGSASPDTIQESAEKAMRSLAHHLEIDHTALCERLNILGHSLGAAAGLNLAAVCPVVKRIVLIAPFTTMRDMAVRSVGIPLNYLLMHNFDNRARLSELSSHKNPPRLTIIHGDRDNVIPVKMGRKLAREFPGLVEYVEIQNADHNGIIDGAEKQIFSAMMKE